MIDITGVNLVKFTKTVYALSEPVGMGFLHYEPGILPDEYAKELIDLYKDDSRLALSLDYVKGRACKMAVFKNGDKLEIPDTWFDHTLTDLDTLLLEVGIKRTLKDILEEK